MPIMLRGDLQRKGKIGARLPRALSCPVSRTKWTASNLSLFAARAKNAGHWYHQLLKTPPAGVTEAERAEFQPHRIARRQRRVREACRTHEERAGFLPCDDGLWSVASGLSGSLAGWRRVRSEEQREELGGKNTKK